jgi:hypothetical protein
MHLHTCLLTQLLQTIATPSLHATHRTSHTAPAAEQLATLRQERAVLADLSDQQNAQSAVENERMVKLSKEISALEAQKAEMPSEIAALQETEAAKLVATQQTQDDIEELRTNKEKTISELTKGVRFFRERLGLDIVTVDQKLQLTFTCIDPAAPQRAFQFFVAVDDEKYDITGVSPPVANLSALVAELNVTNEFSAFVQKMRRAFKATL